MIVIFYFKRSVFYINLSQKREKGNELMHFITNPTRRSKIYSERLYNIPINNDLCHLNMLSEKEEESKVVYEKKQIEQMLQGIIKERMFGNFIKDQTRVSLENYTHIEQMNKDSTNRRIKSHRIKSLQRTIDVCQQRERKFSGKFQTIEMSRTAAFFKTTQEKEIRSSRKSKTFTKKMSKDSDAAFGFPSLTLQRRTTTLKGQKGQQILHQKKLVINQKAFSQFFRSLVGASPNQIIYDFKLTRDILYYKLRNTIEPKLLQRFFHFFCFPSQFSFKQYLTLIQNAANANLRFIYYWVFVLLDENGNGVLTYQDFFRILQKFNGNAYIQSQVFDLVKWMDRIRYEAIPMQPPFEESLTANHNLKIEELKQLMKQNTKERINVNCVKNTCYHQTIQSLQHDYAERVKIDQIESTEETTKLFKKKMMEREKMFQNEKQLRLRDFYVIFRAKRPKIFCFFLQVLASICPEDYE